MMSAVAPLPERGGLAAVVAANIRAEAARRGVRQLDLARVLGLSQGSVSNRFRGEFEWSLTEVEAVARFLRITTSALLVDRSEELPRLDSNQKPFGYWYETSRTDEAPEAEVYSLDDARARRAADRREAVSA